jgi:hypothetical protein
MDTEGPRTNRNLDTGGALGALFGRPVPNGAGHWSAFTRRSKCQVCAKEMVTRVWIWGPFRFKQEHCEECIQAYRESRRARKKPKPQAGNILPDENYD